MSTDLQDKIDILTRKLLILEEEYSLHSHQGTDSRLVDYRYLDNKPISNSNILDGSLGGNGFKIGANGSFLAGQTAYNTGTGIWMEYNNGTPRMSLGVAGGAGFTWDGTTFSISGTITATAGTIGGFTIGSTTITATNLTLTSGAANTANITVGTGSTAAGLNSANVGTDIAIWAGSTFANRATAPFRVEADGSVVATDITATGTINATGGYIGSGTALVFESQGINCGSTGWIRGGMTDYRTGTGWFIGYNTSLYRMSIGNADDTSKLMYWDGTNLVVNDSVISNESWFGDGNDGNLTTTGNVTLTADTYYNNLTVGHTINTAGFRLFVRGTLTINSGGVVERTPNAGGNGGNAISYNDPGAAGAAGAALADGSIKGSLAGIVGKIGVAGAYRNGSLGTSVGLAGTNGDAGANIVKSIQNTNGVAGAVGGDGGNGVASGTGTGAAGGSAGAGGTKSGTVYNQIRNALAAYILFDTIDADQLRTAPSNGGSSSAGSAGIATATTTPVMAMSGATGGSGGGGSQGGICAVFARKIVINTGGIKRANGGAGGNAGTTVNSDASGPGDAGAGGSGGSAGGDGGNGGVLIYVYSSLTNNGTIEAAAGAAGTGASAGTSATFGTGTATAGTAGANGTAGNAGVVIAIKI